MKLIKHADTRKSRKARTVPFQETYDTLLERLIAPREKLGMTQHQVSAMICRSPNFLTKCESGDRSIDVMELFETCRIYQKPIYHFFPADIDSHFPRSFRIGSNRGKLPLGKMDGDSLRLMTRLYRAREISHDFGYGWR